MSNVMKELKAEISRLARKEVKKALTPVQRINAAHRGLIADLRRQIAALQKETKSLGQGRFAAPAAAAEGAEQNSRFWITGKGVRSLRKRLGLTQAEFGKLADVSVPTVVHWESAKGAVPVRRKETIVRLREIRALNKRSAAAALENRR